MKIRSLKGIEVTLRVDGEDLKEYDDDTSEAILKHSLSKYVECTSGAIFAIGIQSTPKFRYKREDLDCIVYLDGEKAIAHVVDRETLSVKSSTAIEGVLQNVDGATVLERFTFAQLHTTDGVPKASSKDRLARLGEITVELRRAHVVEKRPKRIHATSPRTLGDEVPEKALKGRAISNCIKLAEPETVKATNWPDIEYPHGNTPIGVYTFKYRSRRDLQIEDIIPRSPTPVPLEDRDPDTLTLDEARELLRRQRDQLQIKKEIKKEKRDHATLIEDDDSDDGDGEISFEGERSKRSRTLQASAADVVDLTED